jgi:predicted metal-dependent enzyme (double-stranded beta helix superfamily)
LAETDRIAHFLETPSLFRKIRKPLGLSVDFLDPVAEAIRTRQSHDTISDSLRQLEVDAGVLGPYIVYSTDGYQRNWLLYEHGVLEFLGLGWLPGQKTAIHNHGNSDVVDLVVQGAAFEIPFERVSGTQQAYPSGRGSYSYRGDVSVVPRRSIHRLENQGDFNLTTLHANFPPIENPEIFTEWEARTPPSDLSERNARVG